MRDTGKEVDGSLRSSNFSRPIYIGACLQTRIEHFRVFLFFPLDLHSAPLFVTKVYRNKAVFK